MRRVGMCLMSMIGKLRQVSEFDLAKYKKNPEEMMRALAGSQFSGAGNFAGLREMLEQSPVAKKMLELGKQQKVASREEQLEAQQEIMKLMKQAVQMQKKGLEKYLPIRIKLPENLQTKNSISTNRGTACISCLPARPRRPAARRWEMRSWEGLRLEERKPTPDTGRRVPSSRRRCVPWRMRLPIFQSIRERKSLTRWPPRRRESTWQSTILKS